MTQEQQFTPEPEQTLQTDNLRQRAEVESVDVPAQAAEETGGARLAELKRQVGQANFLQALAGGIGIFMLLFLLVRFFTGIQFPLLRENAPILIALLLAAFLASRKRAAKSLLRLREEAEDPRLVGELIEALNWPDAPTRAFAMEALTRLLPRLTSSDVHRITERHWNILFTHMAGTKPPMRDYGGYVRRHAEFTKAALQAIPRVGSAAALPALQKLTQSIDASIRQAAGQCLEDLNARLENVAASRDLLRASGTSSLAREDELLRPASGASPAAPEQLLRASSANEDNSGQAMQKP